MSELTVGTKVRVLDTEWGRAIEAVGQELEIVSIYRDLPDVQGVRVGEGRTLLLNDALDTEFEVIS